MATFSITLSEADRAAIGMACRYAAGRRLRRLLACDWEAVGDVEATVDDWQLSLVADEVEPLDSHPGCIPEPLRKRLLRLSDAKGR